MAGTCDRMIHGYRSVDMQVVWDTVKDDLPVLDLQVEQILAEMDTAE